MTNETPMIWTTKGNLPLDELGDPEIIWELTDTYVKINIIHRLDNEVVRQEAHVLALQSIGAELLAAGQQVFTPSQPHQVN